MQLLACALFKSQLCLKVQAPANVHPDGAAEDTSTNSPSPTGVVSVNLLWPAASPVSCLGFPVCKTEPARTSSTQTPVPPALAKQPCLWSQKDFLER